MRGLNIEEGARWPLLMIRGRRFRSGYVDPASKSVWRLRASWFRNRRFRSGFADSARNFALRPQPDRAVHLAQVQPRARVLQGRRRRRVEEGGAAVASPQDEVRDSPGGYLRAHRLCGGARTHGLLGLGRHVGRLLLVLDADVRGSAPQHDGVDSGRRDLRAVGDRTEGPPLQGLVLPLLLRLRP